MRGCGRGRGEGEENLGIVAVKRTQTLNALMLHAIRMMLNAL